MGDDSKRSPMGRLGRSGYIRVIPPRPTPSTLETVEMGHDMETAKNRIQRYLDDLGLLVRVAGFDDEKLTITIRPRAGHAWGDL